MTLSLLGQVVLPSAEIGVGLLLIAKGPVFARRSPYREPTLWLWRAPSNEQEMRRAADGFRLLGFGLTGFGLMDCLWIFGR